MEKIAISRAVIAWTPNSQLWHDTPGIAAPGSITVYEGPDPDNEFKHYPKVRGSCDNDWSEGDDHYRFQALADLVLALEEDEGLREDAIYAALQSIDGIELLRGYRGRRRDPDAE